EAFGHLGVRLEEGVPGDPEAERALARYLKLVLDLRDAGDQGGLAVAGRLRDAGRAGPEEAVRVGRDCELGHAEVALAGHDPGLELAAPAALTDHEVAEESRLGLAVVNGQSL